MDDDEGWTVITYDGYAYDDNDNIIGTLVALDEGIFDVLRIREAERHL